MSKSIDEIAAEFGLPVEETRVWLMTAAEVHDRLEVLKEWPEFEGELNKFARSVQEMKEAWAALPEQARKTMLMVLTARHSAPRPGARSYEDLTPPRFRDLAEAFDNVLDDLSELASESAALPQQMRQGALGNTKARQLAGLHKFTQIVKRFWLAHKSEPFGCSFDGGPSNAASRFLVACVQWLDPDKRYTLKNCESVMRKANKGEPQAKWRKHDELEPGLTTEDIDTIEARLKRKRN